MLFLCLMGFKIYVYWMFNFYGFLVEFDVVDYFCLWSDVDFCFDEFKIYLCLLIEMVELMVYYNDGCWWIYGYDEFIDLFVDCMIYILFYCCLMWVICDILGMDIVVGNKVMNLWQVVEKVFVDCGLCS